MNFNFWYAGTSDQKEFIWNWEMLNVKFKILLEQNKNKINLCLQYNYIKNVNPG